MDKKANSIKRMVEGYKQLKPIDEARVEGVMFGLIASLQAKPEKSKANLA